MFDWRTPPTVDAAQRCEPACGARSACADVVGRPSTAALARTNSGDQEGEQDQVVRSGQARRRRGGVPTGATAKIPGIERPGAVLPGRVPSLRSGGESFRPEVTLRCTLRPWHGST